MPRFFISASNIFGGIAALNSDELEHMRVLRIRSGEIFTICDGAGTDYTCRMSEGDPTKAEIISKTPSAGEPDVKVTIFAAFSKSDKMDAVIQKCVELGAAAIVVFPSYRCVSKPDTAALVKKLMRYQRIAAEAAKQSERGIIPEVSAAKDYESAITMAARADKALFMYENEQDLGIKSAFSDFDSEKYKTISIVTGPEGGFEPFEAEKAVQAGLSSVSLGKRILRCETAPIAALSAVMCLSGNMGR